MKYMMTPIIGTFLLFSTVVNPLLAAKPADSGNTKNLAVDVTTAPEPSSAPAPTSAPQPTISPEPTAQPTPEPTSQPLPTAAPTAVPTPSPTEKQDTSKKDTTKAIEAAIGQIMAHIEDTPTPTPTPEPVQIIQSIAVKDTPSDKENNAPPTPVKTIQQIIGPSAIFFLHTIPGNYYLLNSLSKTQSASLLLIAFLLMGSGSILLYKTQREEMRRILESFMSRYLLPFWSRQKDILFTIFDRDYAK